MNSDTSNLSSRQRCTYCGAKSKLTKDHVPPRALFRKPCKFDLITVPCCTACHSGTDKDDEYFVSRLCLKQESFKNEDAQDAIERLKRSLQRPDKIGFQRALFKSFFQVPTFGSSGLYLGKKGGFNVDLNRLSRVVERIVRGLYWHETGVRLPKSAFVRAWSEDGLVDVREDVMNDIQRTIVAPLMTSPPIAIGDDTFTYRHKLAADEPLASAWIMTFYSSSTFLCSTIPDSGTERRAV